MVDPKEYIKTVLDVGIAHITKSDNRLLHDNVGDAEDFPVAIMEYRYGYLVAAWHHGTAMEPEEVAQFEKDFLEVGFSKDLLALLQMAGAAGCTWLQLDRDGDVVTGLPVFQW